MEPKKLEDYILDGNIDLDRIIDEYTPYIKKIIQNMVNDNLTKEDKEEIILDTFFVLWKRYNENYYINSLSSYIAGTTKNLIREKLRAIKYNNISIEEFENKSLIVDSCNDIFSQEREKINELNKKINKLNKIDIKLIDLFYYSNKSIKEISKELEMSESNIKVRLHRIRKKIKRELKRGGF